jgi:translation initiation factor IF-2
VAEQLAAVDKKPPQAQPRPPSTWSASSRRSRAPSKVTVNVIVKADAQGAVEGLRKALTELSTEKVRGRGDPRRRRCAITENDVNLAVPSRP